jgi:hypothetical protein
LDLASILTAHWPRFAASQRHLLTRAHYRAADAVMACRTPALGAQVYRCGDCANVHFAYHSCNHRACPRCGGQAQAEWTQAQEAKLLPVSYFMLTFTLPEQLRRFAYQQQVWFYDAMFAAVSATLNAFARDAKHLGGTPGFTAVLHTWTRQLAYHPHLHVIMPGVVLSTDGLSLRRAKGRKYLFPIEALASAFRHRLMKLIMKHDKAEGTRYLSQIDPQIWRNPWVVDSRGVGNGQAAVRYLARYVNKTALSEQRLLGYDTAGNLRLNCQCSATGKWRAITLTPMEFDSVASSGSFTLPLRSRAAPSSQSVSRLPPPLGCASMVPAHPTQRPNARAPLRVPQRRRQSEARPVAPDPRRARSAATARGGATRHQMRLLRQADATRRTHRPAATVASHARARTIQPRPTRSDSMRTHAPNPLTPPSHRSPMARESTPAQRKTEPPSHSRAKESYSDWHKEGLNISRLEPAQTKSLIDARIEPEANRISAPRFDGVRP